RTLLSCDPDVIALLRCSGHHATASAAPAAPSKNLSGYARSSCWNWSDLNAVAEPTKLSNQGSLTFLNDFGVSAAGAMLDVRDLLVENFPDDAEQTMSDSPDGQFGSFPDQQAAK